MDILHYSLVEEALRFTNEYKDLSYFTHALELLLHQTLEDVYPSKKEEAQGIHLGLILIKAIYSVAKFLEHFSSYLDIIVNCARKSEVSIWDYFFSIVGDAKVLFRVIIPFLNIY